eukprot:188584-Rhodomonas_salina.1
MRTNRTANNREGNRSDAGRTVGRPSTEVPVVTLPLPPHSIWPWTKPNPYWRANSRCSGHGPGRRRERNGTEWAEHASLGDKHLTDSWQEDNFFKAGRPALPGGQRRQHGEACKQQCPTGEEGRLAAERKL